MMIDNRTFRIRKMTLDDIEKIKVIEDKSFSSPWSIETFHHEIEENFLATYLVLEDSSELPEPHIFAYGGYWFLRGNVHITNVAVDPDYRGYGFGEVLIKTLLYYAQRVGAKKATLEVRKSNEVAKNLYLNFGFQSFGIRPQYYKDNNEDAVIMLKNIESGKGGEL